jgi:hypothetical protein
VVTPDGCENLAPKWSGTPEEPAVEQDRALQPGRQATDIP